MNKAGSAAARRGVDAAVGAGRGQHAERRHLDEFPRMCIEFGPRFCDHARARLRIDGGKIGGAKIGQWRVSEKSSVRDYLIETEAANGIRHFPRERTQVASIDALRNRRLVSRVSLA